MNSRVSWSVDGIDPSVRDRAEAAARRAGMTLSDWLNSTIGEPPPRSFGPSSNQRPAMPSRESRDVADIHQRLDSITRQIEQISRPAPRSEATRGEPTVARQLNDAISRLDARLSQISNPAPARQAQMQEKQRQTELVERAAAQVYRPSPPLSPASMDFAIAEITARQNELDSPSPHHMPPRNGAPGAAPAQPATPGGLDFSSLERHLLQITSQIEALQRPDHIEESIAAFRSELAEIRQAITEAVPRREIESLENEIRSLSRRIDDSRQHGSDGQTLSGIERALGEIREALRSLTPAEQLTGYDEAIRNLGAKLDLILRSNEDPSTVQQLESAIVALRGIVSNVASNDALSRLAEDVHTLSAKVDQLSRFDGNSNTWGQLEQRLTALTATLETRQAPAASDNSEFLENALRTLSERLDRIPAGDDNASAFAHLEQRVTYLLERLEASNDRSAAPTVDLGRVEEGLHDILRSLERQHASLVALAEANRSSGDAAQPIDTGIVDLVKRELSDIRFSQSETDRRTQDSLETVHNTLGHVVDRLSTIEGDLRDARATPVAAQSSRAPFEMRDEALRAPTPQAFTPPPLMQPVAPPPKPELPNPAALQGDPQGHFDAAPREFHAVQPAAPVAPPLPPRAISEILEPHAAAPRTAIAPELPPDHPLEPGTRPTGRASTPSERIAASENAISEIAPGPKEPVSSSSFIAAARRAAQAAAAAPPPEKAGRSAKAAPKTKVGDKAKVADDKTPSKMSSKIRSLLVGASVVVIVLGTFKMAMTLLDTGSEVQVPTMGQSSEPAAPAQAPVLPESSAKPAMPAMPTAPPAPLMMSPTPVEKQSNNYSAPNTLDSARIPVAPPATPAPAAANDITGAIPTLPPTGVKLAMIAVPPTERLPDGIGSPALRAAALKGDPAAAYEIGMRFAEGKGIAPNLDEAAKWYDRAAQAGVVPAVFRLGTFYEKGLSVKKDVDIARRYYAQAAERGSAKAMHNLAVLDADGGGKGADYKSASTWFRKAADRGVADSQFNLGILYARGIGVEQNLAESFKWFSLAAAQGDADAGRKRDDIAKRLDAQSLAAARLAIQTFTPEPQPDDAINVASPAGGWDSAPAPAPAAAKPAARPAAATKRTAAAH
jgi:localization factor PodJL